MRGAPIVGHNIGTSLSQRLPLTRHLPLTLFFTDILVEVEWTTVTFIREKSPLDGGDYDLGKVRVPAFRQSKALPSRVHVHRCLVHGALRLFVLTSDSKRVGVGTIGHD